MDIKQKAEEILAKVKSDKGFLAEFTKDPVKAVEKIVGVDLPDETVKGIVETVKAKLGADKLADAAGKLGGIFK